MPTLRDERKRRRKPEASSHVLEEGWSQVVTQMKMNDLIWHSPPLPLNGSGCNTSEGNQHFSLEKKEGEEKQEDKRMS